MVPFDPQAVREYTIPIRNHSLEQTLVCYPLQGKSFVSRDIHHLTGFCILQESPYHQPRLIGMHAKDFVWMVMRGLDQAVIFRL